MWPLQRMAAGGKAEYQMGGFAMKERLCQLQTEYAGQPTTTITLEMPTQMYETVQKSAALEGSDPTTLINCFVQQGLLDSKAVVKRMEFAEHAKEVMKGQGIHQTTIDEIFNKILF